MTTAESEGFERVRSGIILAAVLIIISFLCLPAFASSGEEVDWGWIETIGRWFNLLILFGLIYYFARVPVSKFLVNRREGIRKEIQEAHAAREEAERKLADMEARMRDLDTELEAIRRQAEAEARKERERILEQAGEESRKIVASAEREIEGLTRAARQDLRHYVVELSMEMASRRMAAEIDSEAERRIMNRFLVQLTDTSREGD